MNRFSMGGYVSEMQVGVVRAGWITALVAFGWLAFPCALSNLLHPSDVINWHYILQGEHPQKILSTQQMVAGFIEAVFELGILLLVQLVGIVLFYRKAQIFGSRIATPALWPCAALLPGVIGNALFFVFTREFDVTGLVIGLAPMAVTFGAERLCEQLGRDFVFGPRVAGLH
jgi:hypothetical protein